MVELQILNIYEPLSVDICYTVAQLNAVAGEPNTTLHIILAAVDRTINQLAESLFVVEHAVATVDGNE